MRFRAAIVLTLASALLALPARADSLEEVLERMDRAAASFKSFSANVQWVAHTAVINDDDIQAGSMLLKRSKRDMRMRVEFTSPDRKSVALHDDKLELYYPKTLTVDEYDIRQHRQVLENFLLIGFGESGKELAAAYNIKVLGADTLAGQQTTRIELVPKSAEVLQHLKKVELWIPASNVYPVQQKFYLAAGDYKLVTYTNVKVNPPLSDSDLKLKLPKEVKHVTPQK
jgi:outer membrane lipoprotein-sorting protein